MNHIEKVGLQKDIKTPEFYSDQSRNRNCNFYWKTADLFPGAGDLVRGEEDSVVSEEPGGLSDHQETVMEEDELRVQVALLLPVPDNISQHTSHFQISFIVDIFFDGH